MEAWNPMNNEMMFLVPGFPQWTSTGSTSAIPGNVTLVYTPSQLERLFELMASYFERKIDHEEWRKRFAVEHLAHAFGEPHDTVVWLIEGALADADPSGITPISAEECHERIWNICAAAEAVLGAVPRELRKFAKASSHQKST